MLREVYTHTSGVFEKIATSVKSSEPMQNKFLETIIAITNDLGKFIYSLVQRGTAHKGGVRRPILPYGRRKALLSLIREAYILLIREVGGVIIINDKRCALFYIQGRREARKKTKGRGRRTHPAKEYSSLTRIGCLNILFFLWEEFCEPIFPVTRNCQSSCLKKIWRGFTHERQYH